MKNLLPYFVVTLFTLTIFVFLYLFHENRLTELSKVTNRASVETRFHPTYIEVYDRTNDRDEHCNRLIIVHPFDWYVWSISGRVYGLNASPITECQNANNTPAIKIPYMTPDEIEREYNKQDPEIPEYNFAYVCINDQFANIVSSYVNDSAKKVKIPYDMDAIVGKENTERFTLLDMLNYLFQKGIVSIDESLHERVKRDYNNRAGAKIRLARKDIADAQIDLERWRKSMEPQETKLEKSDDFYRKAVMKHKTFLQKKK